MKIKQMKNKKEKTRIIIFIVIIIILTASVITWFIFKINQRGLVQSRTQTQPEVQNTSTIETPQSSSTTPSKTVPANWKKYQNDQYKLSFQYPETFTILDSSASTKDILIFRAIGLKNEEINVYTNNSSPFYNPPAGIDTKDWVINKHGKKFENLGNGNFSNKVGTEVKIDGLQTIHLANHSGQDDYPNDEFYFIKDGRLYQITIINEKNINKIGAEQEINNIDITNSNTWYMQFLQSFKFTN